MNDKSIEIWRRKLISKTVFWRDDWQSDRTVPSTTVLWCKECGVMGRKSQQLEMNRRENQKKVNTLFSSFTSHAYKCVQYTQRSNKCKTGLKTFVQKSFPYTSSGFRYLIKTIDTNGLCKKISAEKKVRTWTTIM